MGAILTLACKDLRLLARDRFGLFWAFAFPLVLAVLFGAMFAGESGRPLKALPVAIADEDQSELSRELLRRLGASGALEIEVLGRAEAREAVRLGRKAACVAIPNGFELQAGLFGNETVVFEAGLDPARRAEASMLRGLLLEAVHGLLTERMSDRRRLRDAVEGAEMGARMNTELPAEERKKAEVFLGQLGEFLDSAAPETLKQGMGAPPAEVRETAVAADALPRSPFEITFPAGMIWGLIGCVSAFALSLARERTACTLRRLRFAPVSPAQVLAGKALACALAGLLTLVLLNAAGVAVFRIRVACPGLLALALACSACCFAGLMALLGTLGRTEQSTAGAGWALLMTLAMFGGAMMPLYFMPAWMQDVSNISPVKWAILVIEGALWRGFTWKESAAPLVGLLVLGAVGFAAGAWRLNRTET